MPKTKITPKKSTSQNEENLSLEKILELEGKLARSLADYSNLERRIESQRQLYVTLATTNIITKMIEVLDDINLAQNHLSDPGLQMAIDKFINVLKSEGLEEINTEGKEFDPQFMDCIEVVDGPKDQVISVKKPGYMLNGHVIRPTQVAVGNN